MKEKTKAEAVESYLRSRIVSGRWTPGQLLPGEREMLAELGVSRTTLRHALSVLVSDGLVVRKKNTGTFVADTQVVTVAILVDYRAMASPFFDYYRRLVDEAKKSVSDSRYRPMLWLTQGDSLDEMIESTALFDKRNLSNTIGVLNFDDDERMDKYLRELGVKTVTMSANIPVGEYSVVIDGVSVCRLAADKLRAHGHDDFAIMFFDRSEDPKNGELDERMWRENLELLRNLVGFREDRLLGVSTQSDWLSTAREVFRDWWAKEDRPRAIFFQDDSLCDIVMRMITELGIRIPQDLAIITHANVGRELLSPTPLTRIGYDPLEVSRAMWNMLQQLIMGKPVVEKAVYVSPHVVEGMSL